MPELLFDVLMKLTAEVILVKGVGKLEEKRID